MAFTPDDLDAKLREIQRRVDWGKHRREDAPWLIAEVMRLRRALERIAEHDGERGNFVNDVFERKSSPQQIALEALQG